MAEWSNAKVCKTFARKGYVGSNPALGTHNISENLFKISANHKQMILSKKQQNLWKVIVTIASIALILTSLAPFLTTAFR